MKNCQKTRYSSSTSESFDLKDKTQASKTEGKTIAFEHLKHLIVKISKCVVIITFSVPTANWFRNLKKRV